MGNSEGTTGEDVGRPGPWEITSPLLSTVFTLT